jgi:(p)ppGpp synthase/HD superfamily hydrolase
MFKHDMPWLGARTSRAAFLGKMAEYFPKGTDAYKLIEKAEGMTFELNKGKVRYSGEPVIHHPRGVALIITERLKRRNHLQVVTAIIHDNREDFRREWNNAFVENEFGHQVDQWLSTVSRLRKGDAQLSKEERNELYFDRFWTADLEPTEVKFADVTYNGLTLDYVPSERTGNRHNTLHDTKFKYLPIARERMILVRELESVVKQAEIFLDDEDMAAGRVAT